MDPGTNSPGRAGYRAQTCQVGSGAGYENRFRVGSGSHHTPGPDPGTSQHFENFNCLTVIDIGEAEFKMNWIFIKLFITYENSHRVEN